MIVSPVDIYSRFCVHSSSTFILFFVSAKIWKELKKITVKHALYWLTKFKHINCLCQNTYSKILFLTVLQ